MTTSVALNDLTGLVLWFDDLGSGNEEYRFLSNFFEGQMLTLPGITWDNLFPTDDPDAETGPVEFKTGEHAFAAMKFSHNYGLFKAIVDAEDPNTAKALGRTRSHPIREDWEAIKLDVMAAVLRAKFTLDRPEGKALLGTGDKMLVEGTWWQDDVWGVDLRTKGMPGRNWLGTLLMARRAELRAAEWFGTEISDEALHFITKTVEHNAAFIR